MTRFHFRAVGAVVLLFSVAATAQQPPPRDPKQYQQTLESADRVARLQVDKVVATLGLAPGQRVADIGAGSGLFTPALSKAVGPKGAVYAIDIDEGLLAIIAAKAKDAGLANVRTVKAGEMDARIPEPVDVIFICDAMHHLPKQPEYVKQFAKQLRPGGRVAVIDFSTGHWPAGHESMAFTPTDLDGWMKAAGFDLAASHDFLASNFFRVYRR